jgi:hypothetical protein
MKSILQYTLMVGIPVVTVLILVQIGERTMKAPAFIGGDWVLETIAEDGGESFDCPALVFEQDPVLSISQSGLYLEISFNDRDNTTFSAMLTGLTITGGGSGGDATHSFSATVDRQPEPDRLAGLLTISSCHELFSFTGSRLPDIDQTSEGH